MSAQWTLTLFVALLSVLNAIAAIALIRQVGLLHLRLRPVPALQGEDGPSRGMELRFETKPWELASVASEVERILIGFFSPTCGICAPLMPAFQSIAHNAPDDETVVLVSDADIERAREYLAEKKVSLPVVAERGALKENRIEGAPFAAVVNRDGVVLAAGGANTLEHLEWLLEQARLTQSSEAQGEPREIFPANGQVSHAVLGRPEALGRKES